MDFELMVFDQHNETYKKSIIHLLNSLRIDHERDLFEISKSVNKVVDRLINTCSRLEIHDQLENVFSHSDSLLNEIENIVK